MRNVYVYNIINISSKLKKTTGVGFFFLFRSRRARHNTLSGRVMVSPVFRLKKIYEKVSHESPTARENDACSCFTRKQNSEHRVTRRIKTVLTRLRRIRCRRRRRFCIFLLLLLLLLLRQSSPSSPLSRNVVPSETY